MNAHPWRLAPTLGFFPRLSVRYGPFSEATPRLAAEATDMRCGFDRLAQRVHAVIGADPLSGHMFLFRSRSGNRLKILTWDRDGYGLWYKRLEVGAFKLLGNSGGQARGSTAAKLLHLSDRRLSSAGPMQADPTQYTTHYASGT